MQFFFHLLTFFVNDTQITQVHARISVKDLKDKTGLHIGKKAPDSSLHKSGKNRCVLQTDGKDHRPRHNDAKRYCPIPVLVITFLDHRNINQDQRGKSTLANIIARFFDPQTGNVLIGGVNVKNIKKEELMDTVSFVFQNSKLMKASILDNVRLSNPNASREEVMEALKSAQCMDIIEKMPDGVDTVIGAKGVYLSGGEQQRIAIARVMLKNSPIIILDEATAFADPDNESRVQKAFSMLSKEKTVIMIAHRLSTVVGADNIFVLQNGQVVEQGTCRELVEQNGLFSQMWHDYQTSVKWKVAKEG